MIQFPHENQSNQDRETIATVEPIATRTFTPTQAVIARSAGVYHWTAEGRRLFDFTSGVLVSNLGHNPVEWQKRFLAYLGWSDPGSLTGEYFNAAPLTAYNAVTHLEAQASRRLVDFCHRQPGGQRVEQVLWAASGSEAIQKSLWAAMHFQPQRQMILATRFGFHGKKGLSHAVTGSENDPERDPRVRFISFPREECADLSTRDQPFDCSKYEAEWHALWAEHGSKIGTVITEPYLGGGGSYHPHAEYLQRLQRFCREREIVFILDEVQANFGRTGELFAYTKYGLEPDLIVLGKGLGNGVPVAAVVGRKALFASLNYGEASDTWSANPLSSAAVAATLDEFDRRDVIGPMRESSAILEAGLVSLKEFPMIGHVRGEKGGMVWGVETRETRGVSANEWANRIVKQCYLGDGSSKADGVHLLGPLAGKVIRISPPLVITLEQCRAAIGLIRTALSRLQ
ncbi:MAG: aminotransferase class III-fold pyridoxal phosphate-dependent enzyme [Gemmataceae bacterium]